MGWIVTTIILGIAGILCLVALPKGIKAFFDAAAKYAEWGDGVRMGLCLNERKRIGSPSVTP